MKVAVRMAPLCNNWNCCFEPNGPKWLSGSIWQGHHHTRDTSCVPTSIYINWDSIGIIFWQSVNRFLVCFCSTKRTRRNFLSAGDCAKKVGYIQCEPHHCINIFQHHNFCWAKLGTHTKGTANCDIMLSRLLLPASKCVQLRSELKTQL